MQKPFAFTNVMLKRHRPTSQPATAITCKEGHVIMLSWPAEQLLAIIGKIIASVVCSMACCVECFDLATIRRRLLQIWAHSRRCAHTRHIWLFVKSLLLDNIDSSATLFLFFCYRSVEIDAVTVATKKRNEKRET